MAFQPGIGMHRGTYSSEAMASKLLARASNLIALTSTIIATALQHRIKRNITGALVILRATATAFPHSLDQSSLRN